MRYIIRITLSTVRYSLKRDTAGSQTSAYTRAKMVPVSLWASRQWTQSARASHSQCRPLARWGLPLDARWAERTSDCRGGLAQQQTITEEREWRAQRVFDDLPHRQHKPGTWGISVNNKQEVFSLIIVAFSFMSQTTHCVLAAGCEGLLPC